MHLVDPQCDAPVVEQQRVTTVHILGELPVCHAHTLLRARLQRPLGIENKLVTFAQCDSTAFKAPDPYLGSL